MRDGNCGPINWEITILWRATGQTGEKSFGKERTDVRKRQIYVL